MAAALPLPGRSSDIVRRDFASLAGWREDDHAAAFKSFRTSCRPVLGQGGAIAGTLPPPEPLVDVCRRAVSAPEPGREAARLFFETWFDLAELAAPGFLTGYFEPELSGSLDATDAFPVPLLAPPDDLVRLPDVSDGTAAAAPGLEGLTAARRTSAGLEPYPDRAAIAAGALGSRAVPVVHLADAVDAFNVHVQGSARIRLPDGRAIRVGFAGRNGHPYTSIGRVLALELDRPPAEMTADRVFAWLKDNPERAPSIMARNRSYIFFQRITEEAAQAGPIGAAGVALAAGRSIAIDRRHWAYGTPIWLDGSLPTPAGPTEALRRLVVAQDTGAAIVGPARGDLFFGSGEAAGAQASLVRHPVRFVAFKPRAAPASP